MRTTKHFIQAVAYHEWHFQVMKYGEASSPIVLVTNSIALDADAYLTS